jgi:hypothetical protein
MKTTQILTYLFLVMLTAQAQLCVTVSPPNIVGQKAVVKLAMKNDLPDKIESARAICFLFDDQGKMVGQSTKWVIGQNHVGLETGATNTFNFVITSPSSFTASNLTARVSFSRVVLAGGKMADVEKQVTMTNSK